MPSLVATTSASARTTFVRMHSARTKMRGTVCPSYVGERPNTGEHSFQDWACGGKSRLIILKALEPQINRGSTGFCTVVLKTWLVALH